MVIDKTNKLGIIYIAIGGGDYIITFDALMENMQKRGKSIYALKKDNVIGGATLDKIRANSQGVTMETLNKICNYLHCKPEGVIRYTPDKTVAKQE